MEKRFSKPTSRIKQEASDAIATQQKKVKQIYINDKFPLTATIKCQKTCDILYVIYVLHSTHKQIATFPNLPHKHHSPNISPLPI